MQVREQLHQYEADLAAGGRSRRNKPYEAPVITKLDKMTFPLDLIAAAGHGMVCRQCSSCHGCR